jgi:excisionase family DNA binding protein
MDKRGFRGTAVAHVSGVSVPISRAEARHGRPTESGREVLTIKEVAALLRLSYSTVCRLAKDGKIPSSFRIGIKWRFRREVIERWMAGDPEGRPQ